MPLNTPNLLTMLRIILIPVFVVVYYLAASWSHIAATSLFTLAAITDGLDGYLARRLDQRSAFGAFLDPVADKLMVSTALVLLVADPRVHALVYDTTVYTVVVAVIVGREIVVSALREWMADLGSRRRVAVSYIAKYKTTGQMVAIAFMVYREPLWNLPVMRIGELLLYAAAALTMWSMIAYLRAAWPDLMAEKGNA